MEQGREEGDDRDEISSVIAFRWASESEISSGVIGDGQEPGVLRIRRVTESDCD